MTGHGWIKAAPVQARCGGPALCAECLQEARDVVREALGGLVEHTVEDVSRARAALERSSAMAEAKRQRARSDAWKPTILAGGELPACVHGVVIGEMCGGCGAFVGTSVPKRCEVGQVWRSRAAPYDFHVLLADDGDSVAAVKMCTSEVGEIVMLDRAYLWEEMWCTGETHEIALTVAFRSQQCEDAPIVVALRGEGLAGEPGDKLRADVAVRQGAVNACDGWRQVATWLRTSKAFEALRANPRSALLISTQGLVEIANVVELVARRLEERVREQVRLPSFAQDVVTKNAEHIAALGWAQAAAWLRTAEALLAVTGEPADPSEHKQRETQAMLERAARALEAKVDHA